MDRLLAQEKKDEHLALVIDKNGLFSNLLAEKLSKHFLTVVVSECAPKHESNVVFLPIKKHLPGIPNGKYTHIFFVWDKDKEISGALLPILHKSKEANSRCIIIVKNQSEGEGLRKNIVGIDKVFVAVVGDLFGTPALDSEIDQLLISAKQTKKIFLDNMGLETFLPVLYVDSIDAILRLSFGNEQQGWHEVSSPHVLTALSLAHLIQKKDQDVKIDFSSQEIKTSSSNNTLSFLLDNTYNFSEKIRDTYQSIKVNEISSGFEHLSKVKKTGKRKTFGNFRTGPVPFVVYMLTLIFLIPLLSTLLFSSVAAGLLASVKNQAEKRELHNASVSVQAAKTYLVLAQDSFAVCDKEMSLVGLSAFSQKIGNTIAQGQVISEIGGDVLDGLSRFSDVIVGSSKNPSVDVDTATRELKNVLFSLQPLTSGSNIFLSYNESLLSSTSMFANVADEIPSILAPQDKRTYLVLFENNTELRPGGGFIGSVGVIHLDHGKLVDFKVQDVYDLDGQLKGHIEPPFAIRRYLPSVHLYLRDTNFDLDFPTSASSAAALYQAESGEEANGVIGVDLSFVKSLLGVTGPIFLPEYNLSVNKNNLFLQTETHAEKNFFPGSTQKKDFLRSVANALEGKLTSGSINYSLLLKSIGEGFQQKHVLVAFADPSTQRPFSVNGLSGALLDPRQNSDQTVNDFLGIFDANLGVNKVNYYIARKVAHTVSVDDDGVIRDTLGITYVNSSKPNTWPGGDYKNYLRVVLPLGATINSIEINGKEQQIVSAVTNPLIYESPNFISKGLEVEHTQKSGKAVFGFLVTVPARGTTSVILNYTLAQKMNVGNPTTSYSLYFFKEAGIDDLPYSLTIQYPGVFKVLDAPGFTKQENLVTQNKNLETDYNFTVNLAKR